MESDFFNCMLILNIHMPRAEMIDRLVNTIEKNSLVSLSCVIIESISLGVWTVGQTKGQKETVAL